MTVAAIAVGIGSAMLLGGSYVLSGCSEIESLYTGVGIEPVTFFHNDETVPWVRGSLIEGESQKILCSPNVGSYLEFLGHKVTVSSRWEVWTAPCDFSPNIFKDTIVTLNQQDGDEDVEGLVGGVARIDWDYAFVSPIQNTRFCDWLAKQPDWEEVSQVPLGENWEPYVPSNGQSEKKPTDELTYRIWKHVRQSDDGTTS